MWLIWVGVSLIVLKLLEVVDFFTNLSWWWIAVPFVLALIWFELFERRLGLDKKKAFDEIDAHKKKRIQEALGRDKVRRR